MQIVKWIGYSDRVISDLIKQIYKVLSDISLYIKNLFTNQKTNTLTMQNHFAINCNIFTNEIQLGHP